MRRPFPNQREGPSCRIRLRAVQHRPFQYRPYDVLRS
nr:MAG TPA: hypothetical protein [Caudoviricetes sp.]DAH85964.1 MAG TPA: hypothetical protein [Caudoviricetes sp.]